jgi:orotate phosphoribosyltransferase
MKTTTTESGIRFVNYALRIGAIELTPEGRKLKSGRISPYFFNTSLFYKGSATTKLAEAYAAAIVKISARDNFIYNVIFGPAYKGIPLAVATSTILCKKYGKDVSWSFNRKETKDHGEGGEIVGHQIAGASVIGIDDVMTSGETTESVVEIVKKNRGILVGYAIAFDRQERGMSADGLSAIEEFQQKQGIPVIAASDLDDLIYVLGQRSDSKSQKTLPLILDYREKYGIPR